MKLILSTSNIMTNGPSVIRRPTFSKSNTELTSSLRANFSAHQQDPEPASIDSALSSTPHPSFRTWTSQSADCQTLWIPAPDANATGLSEERPSYDITVKLFYLPNIPSSRRGPQTREAIAMVLKELKVDSIDLLIVSYPSLSFDADDEDSDSSPEIADSPDASSPESDNTGVEDMDSMIESWRTLEKLHAEGIIAKLGVAEFGVQRLKQFLPRTNVKPRVDQINVRDCCVVPKPLILFAKEEGIELLTHNDCTNVLPRGTVRELLGSGERGAGVLADGESGGSEAGLKGDVEPQWVVKYTAVVKDRGVVEWKGYFAVAELREGSLKRGFDQI